MATASEGITEYARVLCASAGTSPTPRSPKRELPPASHGAARVEGVGATSLPPLPHPEPPTAHVLIPPGLGQDLPHHLLHELREGGGGLPAQLLPGLGGIAQEGVHLGGAEVAGVDVHQGGVGFQGAVTRHGPIAVTGLGEGGVVHRLNHSLLGGALTPPLPVSY